jgi:hypothetical protein
MQKLRDKVVASTSISLTKAQRTRMAVAKKSEQKKNAAKFVQDQLY